MKGKNAEVIDQVDEFSEQVEFKKKCMFKNNTKTMWGKHVAIF